MAFSSAETTPQQYQMPYRRGLNGVESPAGKFQWTNVILPIGYKGMIYPTQRGVAVIYVAEDGSLLNAVIVEEPFPGKYTLDITGAAGTAYPNNARIYNVPANPVANMGAPIPGTWYNRSFVQEVKAKSDGTNSPLYSNGHVY